MSNSENSNGKQIKILVVDDEEIVLSLARDALEDAGYYVELSSSGDEALDIIRKEYYDFILTDIRMPGCDGLELARSAREINSSVGIIFMTGYANLDTAKDAIKEGALDYIMKPFELTELRQAIKNAINKKNSDTEKTLSSELNRLSDLNQLMYTVGDRKSLMRLSLGFAIMQGKANYGKIVFKNSDNEVAIIESNSNGDGGFEEYNYHCEQDYFKAESSELNAPIILDNIENHPIVRDSGSEEARKCLSPAAFNAGDRLVSISLKRGRSLYGFLLLGYPSDSEVIKESELKLLNITASQIAISLENIILLEESRQAYRRLKDLQDETLQLERLATKGQMSAEIGHELNNFLGVVSGNLSLMQHHLSQKNYNELDKYLNAVTDNLDKIKKFTDGLVDFTRLKSRFESCDINELVGDVVESLRAQKQFADVNVNFKPWPDGILTRADVGQLQQLLYNLLNNAADAVNEISDGRDKEVNILLYFNQDDLKYSLIVEDNGVGFDPDYTEKAFKKRFTTKAKGHGFGLLVCRRIVTNHSGDLNYESERGNGSKIIIDFPLMSPVEEETAVSAPV